MIWGRERRYDPLALLTFAPSSISLFTILLIHHSLWKVCISYGVRKDSELLLNYGFLRGVTMEGLKNVDEDESRDGIRQRLAEQFLSRNP